MNLKEKNEVIDITGVKLLPGDPEHCAGNGKADPMKCCCDECDYFLDCFKEWDEFVHGKK